jgi:hypothetical protein
VVWTGSFWLKIGNSGSGLLNAVINLRVPQGAGKFLSSCRTDGFSRRTQLPGVGQLKT